MEKKVLKSAQKNGNPEHLLKDCYVNKAGVCDDECADVLEMNASSTTNKTPDRQIILKPGKIKQN